MERAPRVIHKPTLIDKWVPVEKTLRSRQSSCKKMHFYYLTAYQDLDANLNWFAVPIIILSGVNAILIAGGNSYLPADVVNVTTCVIAMITAIIQSLRTYFKIDDTKEKHLCVYRDMMAIWQEIDWVLRKSPHLRQVDPSAFETDMMKIFMDTLKNAVPLSAKIMKKDPLFTEPVIAALESDGEDLTGITDRGSAEISSNLSTSTPPGSPF